jgi:hypothetical protein
MKRFLIGASALAMLAGAGAARADVLTLTQTIDNPTPAFNDEFGLSIALSGGQVLVGAAQDDEGAENSGAAHLFDAATGALLQTFVNPTPAVNDRFGRRVALSDGQALIGAHVDDAGATNSGVAHLFDAATGALLQTIVNPTAAVNDRFGFSVALSGGQALIGAIDDDEGAEDSGAAHLFDAATGALLQTFVNPTAAVNDQFGWSVALSGGQALIGAILDDEGAEDSGAAYLFNAATGALLQTFLNPTAAVNDQFGYSVALSDGQALIGAAFDDAGAFASGAAYLFDAASGALLQTFLNPTPDVNDQFGWSVALSGGQALIGAYFDVGGGTHAGAAHLFDAASGGLLQTILTPTPLGYDLFGYSVALDAGMAAITAPGARFGGDTYDSGAAYVYATTAAVPLPPAALLLAAALFGLGALRRRRTA